MRGGLLRWIGQLLLLLSCTGYAQTYTATVPIVGADVARARQEAIKELLWEAGLQGGAGVQSTSAVVQDVLAQSTIVTARTRLKSFSLIGEEIAGDNLTITARIDKQSGGPNSCESTLPFRNIKFEWRNRVIYADGPNQYPGGVLFGELLAKTLDEEVGGFLFPRGGNDEDVAYSLVGSLVTSPGPDVKPESAAYRLVRSLISMVYQSEKSAGTQQLRFRLLGANGKLLRVFEFPVGSKGLAINVDEDRGYAKVNKWVLTNDAHALLKDVAATLVREIRCLPALVRIAEVAADGSILIPSDEASLIKQRSIVFFSEAWPIAADGEVDPTLLEGQMQSSVVGNYRLRFRSESRATERKRPAAGGYLIFL